MRARLKVGMIVPGFSANQQDWCIPVLVDVVKQLTAQMEIHVFALRYPYRREVYKVHGATVHALGAGRASDFGRIRMLAAACRAIVAEHCRGRFDVLHGLWVDEPGALAAILGRILGVRSVVSVMGGELAELPQAGYGGRLAWSSRTLTEISLRAADCVTAGSVQAARLAIDSTPAYRRRLVREIIMGIDPAWFASDCNTLQLAGSLRILHVASLVPVKDQATLLRALARVRDVEPDVHLHVAGDGPLLHDLRSLAAEIGVQDAVTFHGYVPREKLPAYYRSADVFVLSSLHEAQCVAVLEAGLAALPIVGTAVGLVKDLAPDAAISVAVGDYISLAASILQLRDSEYRRMRGAAAQCFVRERGLAHHTATQLVSLYSGSPHVGSGSSDQAR